MSAAAAAAAGDEGKPIPLASLSVEELTRIHQRTQEVCKSHRAQVKDELTFTLHSPVCCVAQDIENLTHSMETLAAVVEKFAVGRQSLSAMTPENEGRKCLVPITESVCPTLACSSKAADKSASVITALLVLFTFMLTAVCGSNAGAHGHRACRRRRTALCHKGLQHTHAHKKSSSKSTTLTSACVDGADD